MLHGRSLLKTDFVLSDGAMGTWFAQKGGGNARDCEEANLTDPQAIAAIHREYQEAGARFLRTNTFAAAWHHDPENPEKLRQLVHAGYEIARQNAHADSFVAADFGPPYGLDEAQAKEAMTIMVDAFLDCGATLFLFETFSDSREVLPWCQRIRSRSADAVIMASFSLSPDGLTAKGLPIDALAKTMENSDAIDVWGFNCGIGPTHLAKQLSFLPEKGKPLSLMPNSGYPRMENQRLVYGSAPSYFAQTLLQMKSDRVRILGGCCGTTPAHIRAAYDLLQQTDKVPPRVAHQGRWPQATVATRRDVPRMDAALRQARQENRPFLVCELDPPQQSDLNALIDKARELKTCGIDAITVADSPLARVRLDSITCAARIHRETGLLVLPHLCCRDRNVNGLRSALLAAHSEGIRQMLAVTGDAIPESDRGYVKPVFNVNSVGLIELIQQLNEDVFAADPLLTAAAFDPSAPQGDAELRRLQRKKEAGARLLLTQPLYDAAHASQVQKARDMGFSVLIGLMPLISYRNAMFIHQEIPGIRVPGSVLDAFHPDQSREESLAIGRHQIEALARAFQHQADGFYFIAPFNRSDIITPLCETIKRQDNHTS